MTQQNQEPLYDDEHNFSAFDIDQTLPKFDIGQFRVDDFAM